MKTIYKTTANYHFGTYLALLTSSAIMAGSFGSWRCSAFNALMHSFSSSGGPNSVTCGPSRCGGNGATASPCGCVKLLLSLIVADDDDDDGGGSPASRGPATTLPLRSVRPMTLANAASRGVRWYIWFSRTRLFVCASIHSRSAARALSTLCSDARTSANTEQTNRHAASSSAPQALLPPPLLPPSVVVNTTRPGTFVLRAFGECKRCSTSGSLKNDAYIRRDDRVCVAAAR
jgi:hypothetical protein